MVWAPAVRFKFMDYEQPTMDKDKFIHKTLTTN